MWVFDDDTGENWKKDPQFYLKPNLAATNDTQYPGEKASELLTRGNLSIVCLAIKHVTSVLKVSIKEQCSSTALYNIFPTEGRI